MANCLAFRQGPLDEGEAVAVGTDQAQMKAIRLLTALPEYPGKMVLEVIHGHGEDGLVNHFPQQRACHLHQGEVGDFRHRGKLVRGQTQELILGFPDLNLDVGAFGADKIQGVAGELLDEIVDIVGREGQGAGLYNFGREKPPEAHLEIGGRYRHLIILGFQKEMAEDGHGAPPVHHPQGSSHRSQQSFPFHFQAHDHLPIRKRFSL